MTDTDKIRLEESWKAVLLEEFSQPYMHDLRAFLAQEKAQGKVLFPPGGEIFNAFALTPFSQVRVVILGQDPYHGPGQAHGLCFSVKPGVRPPPSLLNIYKEMEADLGLKPPGHGCLEDWAKRGVLLLNSVLTVRQGEAGSHAGKGWERFTDRVIHLLNEQRDGLVFLLWGAYAQRKGAFIDTARHLVLKAAHPSPLSAHNGFLGCRHFSKANAWLTAQGQPPLDWTLTRQG